MMARKNKPVIWGAFFRAVFFGALASLLTLGPSGVAHAQSMQEVIGISFGRIAITDTSQPFVMSIDRNGNVTKDNAIAVIEPGHPAEYVLENYLPNRVLSISVTAPTTIARKSSNTSPTVDDMTINGFDYPPTVITDAFGSATINIGATLTTGSGGVYADGVYYINLYVTVGY